MGYEERQYRRALKRKIGAMALILLALLATAIMTWDTTCNLQYNIHIGPIAGHDNDSPSITVGRGGVVFGYQRCRDFLILADDVVLTRNPGWHWTTRENLQYPYIGTRDNGIQFAGFEIARDSTLNRIPQAFQYNRTRWAIGCPLWAIAHTM